MRWTTRPRRQAASTPMGPRATRMRAVPAGVAAGCKCAFVVWRSSRNWRISAAQAEYIHIWIPVPKVPRPLFFDLCHFRPLVAHLRSLLSDYPPSSPSMALFRDGKPVYMLHRSDIERRDPYEIAAILTEVFERFCAQSEITQA